MSATSTVSSPSQLSATSLSIYSGPDIDQDVGRGGHSLGGRSKDKSLASNSLSKASGRGAGLHRELGLIYCDDSLPETFAKWDHGRGRFSVCGSFALFWQDYRLVVHAEGVEESFLIEDDVFALFVDAFQEVAVAVSRNILHIISPATEEDIAEIGDPISIKSMFFEYEPKDTNLLVTYSSSWGLCIVSSGSVLSLYRHDRQTDTVAFLSEIDVASAAYFSISYQAQSADEEVKEILKSNNLKIRRVQLWESNGKLYAFCSGDEAWIVVYNIDPAFMDNLVDEDTNEDLKENEVEKETNVAHDQSSQSVLKASTDEAQHEANEGAGVQVQTDGKVDEPTKIEVKATPSAFRLLTVTATHIGEITAFSDPQSTSVFTSGDSEGSLAIWMSVNVKKDFQEIEERSGTAVSEPSLVSFNKSVCERPITCVLVEDSPRSPAIWIGDTSGSILSCKFNLQLLQLTPMTRIVPSSVTVPRQIFISDQSSDGIKRHVLRSVDEDSGCFYDCVLYDSVSSLFRAHPDVPPKNIGPWKLIDKCFILPNLQLLLTCGPDKSLFIWELQNCNLITVVTLSEQLVTALSAVDSPAPLSRGKDANKIISVRLVCGHQKGIIHEYFVKLHFTNEISVEAKESKQNSVEIDDSKVAPVLADSAEIPVFDILDQIQGSQSQILQSLDIHSIPNSFFDDPQASVGDEESYAYNLFKLIFRGVEPGKTIDICSLPVTDVILSKGGSIANFCFAKSLVIIYSMEKGEIIRQVDFEACLSDISPIMFTDSNRGVDDLCVVFQEAHRTTVSDAVAGKKLTRFELDLSGMDIYKSMLWEICVDNDSLTRSIAGICITKGLGVFMFSETIGCVRLLLPDCAPEFDSPLNSLVMGCEQFGPSSSPMVCIWTLRRLLILRVNLGLDGSEFSCMKMLDYTVPDRFVHIVGAKSLCSGQRIRLHRVAVVLSDGSATVITP